MDRSNVIYCDVLLSHLRCPSILSTILGNMTIENTWTSRVQFIKYVYHIVRIDLAQIPPTIII